MRKLALVATGAAVAVAGVVLGAGTAAANTTTDTGARSTASVTATITRPTTGYASPTNQSAPVLTGLEQGRQVTALCFTEGQNLNGNSYWFRISPTPQPAGNTAFVHRDAISVGGDLRHC